MHFTQVIDLPMRKTHIEEKSSFIQNALELQIDLEGYIWKLAAWDKHNLVGILGVHLRLTWNWSLTEQQHVPWPHMRYLLQSPFQPMNHYYPSFTARETKAQISQVTQGGTHSWWNSKNPTSVYLTPKPLGFVHNTMLPPQTDQHI